MPLLAFEHSSLADIPTEPGVYIFLGAKKEVLYVGKAQVLRDRVRSYFSSGTDRRLVSMHLDRFAEWIDFVVTDGVRKALLLENSLIKQHAPRFNVRLRDDKTYFSLRLDMNEPWPWIRIVRRRKKEEGVHYFGPYTSALSCRKTLQFINTLFPLRTCPDSVLANRSRPCISYEIKRCVAPCVGYVERVEYMKIVEQVLLFLKGRNTELVVDLQRRMKEASARLDFEAAAEIRDRIRAIEATVESAHVTKHVGAAYDVVGLYRSESEVDIVILLIRDGVLTSTHSYRLAAMHDTDELLAGVLDQFYREDRTVPVEIILPEDCADMELLREILVERRKGEVAIVVPERGEKKRLLALAEKNAEIAYLQRSKATSRVEETLRSLQEQLGIKRLPRRIECFDISNLMGTHVVGSCVAFLDGRPDKQRYRRFKIRTVEGQDDFAGMAEIVRRRITRGLREDDLPDLIVIDGGPPQLARAEEVLRSEKVDSVDLVGLAKARTGMRAPVAIKTKERIFKPDSPVPIVLEQNSDEMKLLVQVRDEAHRFAITYHRRLREKSNVTSVLELVPGIARAKARLLLQTFGSVAGVRAASDEALSAIGGITPRIVANIRSYFENAGRVADDAEVDETASGAGDEELHEPEHRSAQHEDADGDEDLE